MAKGYFEGLDTVTKNLNKSIEAMKLTGGKGILKSALYLSGRAVKNAPVVSGNLRASRFVTYADEGKKASLKTTKKIRFKNVAKGKGKLSDLKHFNNAVTQSKSDVAGNAAKGPAAQIGFGAMYAVYVHENPRAGKTGGVSPSGKKYTSGLTEGGNKSTRKRYSTVGGWKFLEKAIKRNKRKVLIFLKEEIELK